MTKSDHPTAAAQVKSADKMVMLPPLFDGIKPEVVKQPNPKDLEGVDEDQLLAIQKTIRQQLKEKDAERERNITKKIQKYDFINKALLESVAQITEMTKSDHPTAAARVKSADKMVMLPPLFDGIKPEVVKQHYKRFNQYIKFQTKSGNIRDPIAEAIELFKHAR